MTAITILVSGFVLQKSDPDIVVNQIYRGLSFIAPQIASLEEQSNDLAEEKGSRAQLKEYLQGFVEANQSGVVDISGLILPILIVIQLFSSIEDALNDIWGVKRGRSWTMRVGLYWIVITLGTVGAPAGLALLAAQALKWNDLASTLPGGEGLLNLISWISKAGNFLMLSAVLATFYRFIPNTPVTWRASFIGAFVALFLIGGNNAMAFAFYSNRVSLDRSLYESLAIVLLLMFGTYVFWLFMLLGGRVSFAVQNAYFKSNKMAWEPLNYASKESISILLFSIVCRRFRDCKPVLSGRELTKISKLPVQYVNAKLMRLYALKLVSSMPPEAGEPFQNYRCQPAKPLDKIELCDFRNSFEKHGDMPDEDLFDDYDPIVERYHDSLEQARKSALGDLAMEDVIDLSNEFEKSSSEKPQATDSDTASTFL